MLLGRSQNRPLKNRDVAAQARFDDQRCRKLPGPGADSMFFKARISRCCSVPEGRAGPSWLKRENSRIMARQPILDSPATGIASCRRESWSLVCMEYRYGAGVQRRRHALFNPALRAECPKITPRTCLARFHGSGEFSGITLVVL